MKILKLKGGTGLIVVAFGFILLILGSGSIPLDSFLPTTPQNVTPIPTSSPWFYDYPGNLNDTIKRHRYNLVVKLENQMVEIEANLNRIMSGQKPPPGFFVEYDGTIEIVPLSNVFNDIEANKALLTQEFYDSLKKQAELLLEMAQAKDINEFNNLGQEYLKAREEVQTIFTSHFGLENNTLSNI